MAHIEHTSVCALGRLRASNDTSLKELKQLVEKKRAESMRTWTPSEQGGETAILCTTTTGEEDLGAKLDDLGFLPLFQLKRRNGYGGGKITLWILNL